MIRPLEPLKALLRRTGLAEGLRRAKQAAKRRLHRDEPLEPLAPGPPLLDGLPPEVAERLVCASGPDADLAVAVEPTAFLGGRFTLRVDFTLRSLDFAANWMKIALLHDGEAPLDLRPYAGVGLFVDGGGAGGQFLVTVRDEDGGAFAFNSPTILHGRGFRPLACDFARFFRPAWERDGTGEKVFSRVRAIEFSVRPGDAPLPHRGTFRLTGLRALHSYAAAVAAPVRIRSALAVDDLSAGAEERFAAACGPDAALAATLDRAAPHQGRPSLRVEGTVRTARHDRNYAVLTRALDAPVDATGFAGVALFIRAARSSALLRVILADDGGGELVAEEPRLLREADEGDGFRRVFLALARFRHPEWSRRAAPARLDRLAAVSLALLPGNAAPPVEATFHLGGIFLVRAADETPVAPARADAGAPLVEDLLVRAAEPGAARTDAPCFVESDALGPFLAADLAAPDAAVVFPLPAPRYLLAAEHLFVRLAAPPPAPPVAELRTPAGDLYESAEAGEVAYGADRMLLYPLASFRRAGGGIRFPDAVRALGHADAVTLRPRDGDGGGLFKIRQIGLASGGAWSAPPAMPAADAPAPSGPANDPAADGEAAARFLLSDRPGGGARAAATRDPRALKEEDDRTGGEFGLARVAMFVEPTNLCNLRCIMCNHGDHSFRRGLGVMKARDFRRIAAEIRQEKLRFWEFSPYWYGEPFIHPQIAEFLDECDDLHTAHGAMRHCNIHTNGANLTEKHLRRAAASSLTSVLFSVDAATAGTHAKIRRGGQLAKVVEAIERLRALRDAAGRATPAIIAQFIVMDENAHEISDFAKFWAARGIRKLIYAGRPEDNPFPGERIAHDLLFPQTPVDCVFVKALEPNALTKHQTHREALAGGEARPAWRPVCASLFRMLAVGWDGEATACCRDDQVEMGIGNIFRDGIVGVWYGERLRALRLAHVTGELSALPKCAACRNWGKEPLPPAEVTRWLRQIGRPELAGPYLARTRRPAAG